MTEEDKNSRADPEDQLFSVSKKEDNENEEEEEKADYVGIDSLKDLLRLFRVTVDDDNYFDYNGQKYKVKFATKPQMPLVLPVTLARHCTEESSSQ